MLALAIAAQPAMAALVFRIGDTVYVDGQRYSWDEWKKLRDSDRREAAPAAIPAADITAVRAASCVTPMHYAEFPSDDERFDCSGGLGALTRDDIMHRGWRIDYVEKVPTTQASGVQLYKYKLILSR
jgi:hypothetical protein